jgi:hypothetical protein
LLGRQTDPWVVPAKNVTIILLDPLSFIKINKFQQKKIGDFFETLMISIFF